MGQFIKQAALCESERELAALVQRLCFGRIEHLPIKNGKPVMKPRPRIVAKVKMAGGDDPAPNRAGSHLKESLTSLFALMRRMGDGELLLLEVRHGQPFLVEIEWSGDRLP